MAPKKTNAELIQEVSDKEARLQTALNEIIALKAQLAADNAAHAEENKHVSDQFDVVNKKVEMLEKKIQQLLERGPATRPAPASYLSAAREDVPRQTDQERRNQQQQEQQQPWQQARQRTQARPADETHKFVVYAAASKTSDEVMSVVADTMGINHGAFKHVEKIKPRGAPQPAAPAPANAAPSSSTAGTAALPERPPNAVFVFTTSKYVADQAIKGTLRQRLREGQVDIFIDDYLTREEKEERKRRAGEKRQLKEAGVKAAWRRATLWMLESVEGRDVWKLVDVQRPAAAEPAATDAS